MSEEGYIFVVLIYVSLVTIDVEHFCVHWPFIELPYEISACSSLLPLKMWFVCLITEWWELFMYSR